MKLLILNGPNLNMLGQREPGIYGSETMEACLKDLRRRYSSCGKDSSSDAKDAAASANSHPAVEPAHPAVEPARSAVELQYFQSNSEGALIDRLQQAWREGVDGVVFNAGAYTHTSVALHDAIKSIAPIPVVEVHISNIHTREEFRHTSMIAAACKGVICGFGLDSYRLAIEALL